MNPIIWLGLVLIALPTAGFGVLLLIEKRREQKEKRLECLKDPVVVRQIFSR